MGSIFCPQFICQQEGERVAPQGKEEEAVRGTARIRRETN